MDTALTKIRGLGPARVKAFQLAGIQTVGQLLSYLPAEYRDLSDVRPIDALRPGVTAAVRCRVASPAGDHWAGRLHVTKVRVSDDSGSITVVWYNQPWRKNELRLDKEMLLYGRVEARYGEWQLIAPTVEEGESLTAVYRPIAGIPAKTLAKTVRLALEMGITIPDGLPDSLKERHGLLSRGEAIYQAHLPSDAETLAAARRRLAFEELLLYQVALWLMRGVGAKGVRIPCGPADGEAFLSSLPFKPTGAQRRVLGEILGDMAEETPMARLVQGDVGCGKTAVAFAALYAAAKHGWQGAMMAPTEVLAQQHYDNALRLLEPLGVRCGLLTGSMTPKQHREAREALASGEWQVALGTHALITEGVVYKNLGLVVTDEQHRFGVRQRTLLGAKGDSPNVLVMSATPIPRTLALILYGDLDISIVDELPPGRTPIKTRLVPEKKREAMYRFICDEVAKGRQAYVVCPLVEESEAVDALPAEAVYKQLREGPLKALRVGLAHGRMRPREKEEAIRAFRDGETDVLVSTTVIEVGVDVPNASVMVVENAERFGLAQLHQLRGRVGRGARESWCFLLSEENQKLKLMTETSDGFVIAQKDMELRGPGELFGYRQSGEAAIGVGADAELLKETHDEARALLKEPESPESAAVIALAQSAFADRLHDLSMN